MPNKPLRACSRAGCGGFAVARSDYCEKHQPTKDNRAADVARYHSQPGRAFYNHPGWTKHLRPRRRAEYPICEYQITDTCKHHGGDPSTEIDHRIDHKGDPKLFFDYDNLAACCKPCHDRKTGLTTHGNRKHAIHSQTCLMRQGAGICTCDVNDASVPI